MANSIPVLEVRGATTDEFNFIASNPKLREAIWRTMRNLGYTDEQISWNEHSKGRHTSKCSESSKNNWHCQSPEGSSYHSILDKYNQVQEVLIASELVEINFV